MQAAYIGVTGIQTAEDAQLMELLAQKASRVDRKIMVGILVCDLTLRGKPSPWKSYPPVDKISSLFKDNPHHLNIIHYNRSPKYFGESINLMDDLRKLIEISGPNFHGFQINPPIFPTKEDLQKLREEHPHLKIILSAPRSKKEKAQLLEYFNEYAQATDYILLDKSYGTGKSINAKEATSVVEELGSHSIVLAGGLEAGAFAPLYPLLEKNPHLSFDAQGRIQNKDGSLNHSKTLSYVEDAIKHIEKATPGIEL